MEKKYCRSHIGEIHTTKEGYEATIIDGGKKNGCCTIQIEDWIHEVEYSNIKKGTTKYPYHRTLFNIGYLGSVSIENCKKNAYNHWSSLIRRSYDPKYHEKKPTYKDVTVCEEWHNFQNFAEWFDKNYIEGYDLDKDLLSGNKKVYSPETCIYIPKHLNSFMTNVRSDNTSGETGVSWSNAANKWAARINFDGKNKNLGVFVNKHDASDVYKAERRKLCDIMRDRYKNILPKKALESII